MWGRWGLEKRATHSPWTLGYTEGGGFEQSAEGCLEACALNKEEEGRMMGGDIRLQRISCAQDVNYPKYQVG